MMRWALLVPLLLAGCATSGPPVDRLTPDQLVERGIQAYESGRYGDAVQALERFTLNYPGHPRATDARYYLAQAYLERKEYLSAANEFSRLSNEQPLGPYAAASRFGVCDAYYRLSPRPELDQEYTRAALDHCQALIAYYPDSEFTERAREMVTELDNKLAEKEFLIAEHYFKIRAFDSAILYYSEVLASYPRTAAAPRALLRIIEAYTRIGWTEEAEAARERLLREYPGSAEASVARAMPSTGDS